LLKNFTGKTVIITGGSNGIGKGIAKAFGKEGANVCIADREEEKGKDVVRLIEEAGGKAAFYQTDVRKEDDIINLLDKVISEETKMPVLIAEDPLDCVAIGTGKALEHIDLFKNKAKESR